MPLPAISASAPTSRHTYSNATAETCSDCWTMTQECTEPLCSPLDALTTQCTDQCVVIACDDPDHGISLCDKQATPDGCDARVECVDCHGFDAFCCDNYDIFQTASQRTLHHAVPNPAFSWDGPFGDIWCNDCGPHPLNFSRPLDSTQSDGQSVTFSDMDLLTCHLLQEHLGVSQTPTTPMDSPAVSPIMQSTLSPNLSVDTIVQTPPTSVTQVQQPVSSPSTPGCKDDLRTCIGPHECKWTGCSLFFSTCTELTAHITAIHIGSGKARYECFWRQCNRNGESGFQSKQKICRHVQSHTGHRPFQCAMCQQYFSEAATLQQHIRRHKEEKPYICDYPGCGKSFAITGALTIHKRTHNGDKPFKCPRCPKSFAESSNLSKHVRTHTGARPYLCTEHGCSKAFARPDQRNRHKIVHMKQRQIVGS